MYCTSEGLYLERTYLEGPVPERYLIGRTCTWQAVYKIGSAPLKDLPRRACTWKVFNRKNLYLKGCVPERPPTSIFLRFLASRTITFSFPTVQQLNMKIRQNLLLLFSWWLMGCGTISVSKPCFYIMRWNFWWCYFFSNRLFTWSLRCNSLQCDKITLSFLMGSCK